MEAKPAPVALTEEEKAAAETDTGSARRSILMFIQNCEAAARDDKRARDIEKNPRWKDNHNKRMLEYQGRANGWKYVLALLDTKSLTTDEWIKANKEAGVG